MMRSLLVFSLPVFAFFCGAIPTGYLLIKVLKQQDIRKIGSGNIGSTNVRRAAGSGFSLITQVIDILKGLIPVGIALFFDRNYGFIDKPMLVCSATALASILGHDFSPFLRFRGGKGVNTTIGSFLLLAPIPVLIGICVFYALRILTKIVSIRSLTLGFIIPIMTVIFGFPATVIFASWIAALLILVRHAENIHRLLQRTELR